MYPLCITAFLGFFKLMCCLNLLMKIRKKYLNARNENSSENGQATSTNIACTSNVRWRSTKSEKSTTNSPQKRTASQSWEGKAIKRLKVLQIGQNTNNVRNDLVEYSVMTIARNRRGRNNNSTLPNDDNIITISEDDDDNDVEIIEELNDYNIIIISEDEDDNNVEIINSPTTFICRRTINNMRKERTNKRRRNNAKYPETPKPATVTINEEESNSHVEISSEAQPKCPICLKTLKDQEMSVTTCGHAFCKECILAVTESNKMCPICRTPLTEEQIHPLFI